MNKTKLAEKIADKVGISRSQAEQTLDSFVENTVSELKQGGEVVLTGFGTFSARKRKGRIGINPRNPSEKITIPDVLVAKFKAGKNLKDELKKAGEIPTQDTSTETPASMSEESEPNENQE